MLLSYNFHYAKTPNKTSLLAAFYTELFFWKTNATLKHPPSEVYVNPIPNLLILNFEEQEKKTFPQSGNDRLFLFFFFFVKDCF